MFFHFYQVGRFATWWGEDPCTVPIVTGQVFPENPVAEIYLAPGWDQGGDDVCIEWLANQIKKQDRVVNIHVNRVPDRESDVI